MYVERLNLLNIRSYPTATLQFSKGINIILGPNNAGKSTILRSLQKLQKQLGGIIADDVRKTKTIGKIHIQLGGITEEEKALFQIENSRLEVGKHQSILLSFWNYGNGAQEGEFLQIREAFVDISSDEDDFEVLLRTGHTPGDEDFNKFPQFSSRENENNFIYPFLAKRRVTHFSNQAGAEAAYGINEQLHNLPSRIQSLLNDTHPYSDDYKRLAKDILGFAPGKVPGSKQANEDKLGIFVRTQDSVYLESMGDGVANILGLLAILLTDNNKLFLIEELENDIHPEALKKLLNLIIEKSATNQFVITTHSNIVLKYLASLPDTKIFYTNWTLEEVVGRNRYKIPTSNIIEVTNTPQDRLNVLSRLGYDYFDFDLFTSYILFEESSAERLVRDFLIPWFVPSLKNKVKTIAAGGVDDLPARFSDFLRLFVFVHTSPLYKERAWVIADGDDAGKEVIAKLRYKFNWPKEHFLNLQKCNIEEYYPPRFKGEADQVLAEKEKGVKFEKKKQLADKVMTWIQENPAEAQPILHQTAKELIDLLLEIEQQLQKVK